MIDIVFAFGEQITHLLELRVQETALLFPSCGDTVRGSWVHAIIRLYEPRYRYRYRYITIKIYSFM